MSKRDNIVRGFADICFAEGFSPKESIFLVFSIGLSLMQGYLSDNSNNDPCKEMLDDITSLHEKFLLWLESKVRLN